jgi:hypothetical protein
VELKKKVIVFAEDMLNVAAQQHYRINETSEIFGWKPGVKQYLL